MDPVHREHLAFGQNLDASRKREAGNPLSVQEARHEALVVVEQDGKVRQPEASSVQPGAKSSVSLHTGQMLPHRPASEQGLAAASQAIHDAVPMNDPNEVAQARFRKLLQDVGATAGAARGWKARVARSLDVTPEHFSRLLSGARKASTTVLTKAADVYGFSLDYYSDRSDLGGDGVHYSTYARGNARGNAAPVRGSRPRAEAPLDPRLVRFMADECRSFLDANGSVPVELARAFGSAILRMPLVQNALAISASTDNDLAATAHAAEAAALVRKLIPSSKLTRSEEAELRAIATQLAGQVSRRT